MKRLSLSCATLIAGLGVIQIPALAQNTASPKPENAAPPNVVISEVCYWPKKGEPEWVELANVSDKAVDIKGWQLVDGQVLDFVVSEKPLSMPPKGYLVVKLDGAGQPPTPFNQSKAVAHSPRGVTGNLLGDKGGHLALYSAPIDKLNAPIIRGYVAWGWSPGRIIEDAMKSQRWSHVTDSVLGTDSSTTIWGPARSIQQGGSIGLIEPVDAAGYAKEHWGIFTPSEVSPGQSGSKKRGPTLSHLTDEKTDENGMTTLSVVRMPEAAKYQFQVCIDKNCQQIFLDAVTAHDNYPLEKPIPRNTTYYWRARLIYPDGSTSQWSEVRSLTNGYPK